MIEELIEISGYILLSDSFVIFNSAEFILFVEGLILLYIEFFISEILFVSLGVLIIFSLMFSI